MNDVDTPGPSRIREERSEKLSETRRGVLLVRVAISAILTAFERGVQRLRAMAMIVKAGSEGRALAPVESIANNEYNSIMPPPKVESDDLSHVIIELGIPVSHQSSYLTRWKRHLRQNSLYGRSVQLQLFGKPARRASRTICL
jgi:hypothetical protein